MAANSVMSSPPYSCLLLLCLVACVGAASDVVLPAPAAAKGVPVAAVMLQGALIDASAYEPLLRELQAVCQSPDDAAGAIALWAAAPQYALSTVNPADIAGGIKRVLAALTAAGMPVGTKVFLMGHSLGGAMLDLYVHGHPAGFSGAVFMGSFIGRSRRSRTTGHVAYPVPSITLAGELDGLARVSRTGAEAFYAQIVTAPDRQAAIANMSVVVLPGVSHMQFASGTPPALVQARDLMPEVTYDEAHHTAATVITAFLQVQATAGNASALHVLTELFTATEEFVTPMITALQQEGSPNLQVPCNSDFPSNPTCNYPKWPDKALVPGTYPKPPNPLPPTTCTCGSPWVMTHAHRIMAGFEESPKPDVTLHSADAFHDVSDVRPFHLPHIFNECQPQQQSCSLNLTTVDMLIFETLESEDTGFISISAIEMRVKMKSREAMWQAAGIPDVDYNTTDLNTTRCKAINQAVWDWAKGQAGSKTMARFDKVGEPYVIGEDVNSPIGITGPTWIKKQLEYTRAPGPTGRSTMVVQSPYFAIANKNDGNVSYLHPVGYHYCKLLSPARAMEWIYVDGLRYYASLNNHSSQSLW